MTIREFIKTEFNFKTEQHTKRFARFRNKFISLLDKSLSDSIDFDKQILYYVPICKIESANNIDELNVALESAITITRSYRDKYNINKRKKIIKSETIVSNDKKGIYNVEGIISKSNDLLQYIGKVPFAEYADNPNMYNLVKNIKAQIVSAKIGLTKMYNKTKIKE